MANSQQTLETPKSTSEPSGTNLRERRDSGINYRDPDDLFVEASTRARIATLREEIEQVRGVRERIHSSIESGRVETGKKSSKVWTLLAIIGSIAITIGVLWLAQHYHWISNAWLGNLGENQGIEMPQAPISNHLVSPSSNEHPEQSSASAKASPVPTANVAGESVGIEATRTGTTKSISERQRRRRIKSRARRRQRRRARRARAARSKGAKDLREAFDF